FYNGERPHPIPWGTSRLMRSTDRETGWAKIVDRFGETTLGQRQTAAIEVASTT
ncbi:hypothetical protein ThidrDRAFT_4626, partial [Thiorhodococcus drewsii AZ1]